MICRYCGQQMTDGMDTCAQCGRALIKYSADTGEKAQSEKSMAAEFFPPPVKYREQDYEKSKRVLIVLLAAMVFGMICIILSPLFAGYNAYVKKVQTSKINVAGCENRTWEDVLNEICTDTKWEYFKQGYARVIFTGRKKSGGDDLEITFVVRRGIFNRRRIDYYVNEICCGREVYKFKENDSYSNCMYKIIND